MYDRRSKVVLEDEQKHWEHINPSCMTEESDEDGGEKIVTHKLQWRSPGVYLHIFSCTIVIIILSFGGVCEDTRCAFGKTT